MPFPLPLPLPGSEEAFQTIFPPEGPVGVTNPGFFLISWTGREEEKEGEGVHGLLAPAAFTVGLAEPPVASEERLYDDCGGGVGLVRLDDLTAVVAALAGALAGWAAELGAEAWTGLLLQAAGFSLADGPEGVERLRDGDVGFFSAVEAGFGREEEEARAGKLASVFSYGFDAVAVEEEAAAVGQAAAAGAAPATTTGAVPGFWTM